MEYQQFFEYVRTRERERLEHYLMNLEISCYGLTPIEQLMYLSLSTAFRGSFFPNVIQPQYEIGNYKADFLITCLGFKNTSDGASLRRLEIVVECDGHDYHERTKQQASSDKKRDRCMTGLGYTVLRFTGSDIYKDPMKCAEEVYEIAKRKLK